MKYLKQIMAFSLLLLVFKANAQDGIVGKWKGEDKPNNHMEIFLAKNGLYYGKLVYENGKTENLGKQLLKDLKFDASTNTFQGTMMPPDRNLELTVTITPLNTDKIKVVAKKFLITKTIYFIKIK